LRIACNALDILFVVDEVGSQWPFDNAETPEWSRNHEDVEHSLADNQGRAARS